MWTWLAWFLGTTVCCFSGACGDASASAEDWILLLFFDWGESQCSWSVFILLSMRVYISPSTLQSVRSSTTLKVTLSTCE